MTRIRTPAPALASFRTAGAVRNLKASAPMKSVVGNVLIVEDDRATREVISTILILEGFHAITAEDGLEALHLLRTVRHRAPKAPCLILLDFAMPRLGGSE